MLISHVSASWCILLLVPTIGAFLLYHNSSFAAWQRSHSVPVLIIDIPWDLMFTYHDLTLLSSQVAMGQLEKRMMSALVPWQKCVKFWKIVMRLKGLLQYFRAFKLFLADWNNQTGCITFARLREGIFHTFILSKLNWVCERLTITFFLSA